MRNFSAEIYGAQMMNSNDFSMIFSRAVSKLTFNACEISRQLLGDLAIKFGTDTRVA